MHCNEDDADAPECEQSSTADSMNVVSSKSRKDVSGYFEMMLRAGSRTRELAQA